MTRNFDRTRKMMLGFTKNFKLVALLIVIGINLNAQYYFHEGSGKSTVPVQSVNKKLYRFPWTGGMNSCQFGQIDLNLDGVKDLFVFDRHGDRIMSFVNGGTPGAVDYDFAPEYADSFPELKDWVILTDYDNDGKEDIFTKSPDLPGIIVYKNISVTTVEFELVVYPFLLSYQGGGYVNILVTDVDFPGISDIDGDGDLDILTFWGLGSFVEFHENQSIEKYGIPDSLDYIKTQNCWGHFAESDESNTIYLDTCSNGKQYPVPGKVQEKKSRHTGSSFLLLDMDQDNDKDLLLGDVGYPNIVLLTNGGNADSASITEYDTLFPSDNKPVNLVSMPSVAYLDINNNGINDLVLSPFDPALDKSKNKRSAWLYLNEGENNNPQFTFDSEDFLQDDMIDVGSGAYPVLCDYDGDGLTDLLISNFGDYIYSYYSAGNFLNSVYWSKISLFRNTGTAENPKFNLVTDNFAQLDTFAVQGFFPAFSDLDNDGDTDMLTGLNDGTIWFFENTSGSPLAMIYKEPVKNYQGIDVGNFSTPQLFDLDGDGLKDLIAGEENGNLNYFNNTGTPSNPFFTFITDSLGKVNVTNYQLSYSGFSTPCFFRGDQNQTRLIVGSEEGRLFYYKNIDGNLGGTFTPNDSLFVITGGEPKEIRAGIRTAAALSDLNNDGFPDLIVGNFSGGLNYFSGSDSPPVIGMDKQLQPTWDVIFFPNPTKEKLVLKLTGRFSFLHLQISFYNSMTQLVFSGLSQSNEIMEIPVISFAPGVYSCEIRPLQVNVTSLYKKVIIAR